MTVNNTESNLSHTEKEYSKADQRLANSTRRYSTSDFERQTGLRGKTLAECDPSFQANTDVADPQLEDWQKAIQANAAEAKADTDKAQAKTSTPSSARPDKPKDSTFKLCSTDDLRKRPRPNWAIYGVLAKNTVNLLYGESGAGKTFVALHTVACLMSGNEWNGQEVDPFKSGIYVNLEGSGLLSTRIDAYEKKTGSPFPAVQWAVDGFNFTSDFADLYDACPDGSLVVVDTLAASAPDLNINDQKDMALYAAAFRTLVTQKNCTVIIVHHCGKDLTKGAAGSFILKANFDSQISVSRKTNSDLRVIKAEKVRDGVDGTEWLFELEQIQLGVDDDGREITSCAVNEKGVNDGEKTTKAKPLNINTKPNQIGWQTLEYTLVKQHSTSVYVEDWRTNFYAKYPSANQTIKRNKFNTMRADFERAGLVRMEVRDGLIFYSKIEAL